MSIEKAPYVRYREITTGSRNYTTTTRTKKNIVKEEIIDDVVEEIIDEWDNEDILIIKTNGDSISLGENLESNGDVVVDWGDGTTETINNPIRPITHNYTDGESEHIIRFNGEVLILGIGCFNNCINITSVKIPSTVTDMEQFCFYNCTNLTEIKIPTSITSIPYRCFGICTSLTSINLPSSITSIGVFSFENCTALTSINIPSSVTTIEGRSFYGCSALETVIIPSSVTNMGTHCFTGSINIIDCQLYWENNDIISYNNSIMPNNNNVIFTIPKNSTSDYINKGYPSDKLVERE